jgi:O-6-methylguanine DNA methyltransferase
MSSFLAGGSSKMPCALTGSILVWRVRGAARAASTMDCVAAIEVTYDVDGWGTGTLWFADGQLVWHELPSTGKTAGSPRDALSRARRATSSSGVDSLIERIQAYFAGEPVGFDDVEIDLDWCTPFQRAVADTLRRVSYGEIVSYGELAALAGYPNAQRAAGTFCAHNRVPLVIPCHRVVSANGLGSYGSLGTGFKRRLLELEGVSI